MKIYAGSDHAGLKLKGKLVGYLREKGHEIVDLGTTSDAPTDYPDWAAQVARAVRDDQSARGLVVCGSGVGVCIAANKVAGVRAVDAWTPEVARISRSHNDTNVLCLGERLISEDDARAIADAWLSTSFEGGRHTPRLTKIAAVESGEAALVAVRQETRSLSRKRVPQRIWDRDPSVFTSEALTDESVRKSILNRLGWLTCPTDMAKHLDEVVAFAGEIRQRGFKDAVLLGMGGSSLCPEVLAKTFGQAQGLRLHVLDNTDPAAVSAIEAQIDPERTLFVVASKSGGTIEVASFESYFWTKALARGVDKARAQFCAITDKGTELHHRARDRYGKVFVNPSDIGGRYSALSLFGLVPAALLGIDVRRLLGTAQVMATACREGDAARNPGASLGAFMAALAKQGRDKLTLLMSPEVGSLGAWIEQLVAESTGKRGKGVVPIDLEPLGAPESYDDDRAFVVVRLTGGKEAASPDALRGLRAAGHPVLEIDLGSAYDLGAEFFRWEFATAVAGAALAINPFDEPNVTEAKEATGRALKTFWDSGKLPEGLASTDAEGLRAHLGKLGPGDYLAFCAFFHATPGRERALEELRPAVRDRRRAATTVGFGPRFLHSTGQLHKGGPNNGVFVQLTADAPEDLAVPERGFSFATLRDAQALGDVEALRKHQRRVVRIHLGRDVEAALARLKSAAG